MTEKKPLRIAAAQINCTVGDFDGNCRRVLEAARRAREAGAHLLACPEMAVTGYPAEDWVLRADFRVKCAEAVDALETALKDAAPGLTVVVGGVAEENGRLYNALFVLGGEKRLTYAKRRLPQYGVFDEKRLFTAGETPLTTKIEGTCVGFAVCEDLWNAGPARELQAAGAGVIVAINASPFETGKRARREAVVCDRARENALPVVYVNAVGGQDELVFDGSSFACDSQGNIRRRLAAFEEDFAVIDLTDIENGGAAAADAASHDVHEELYAALVTSVRDFVRKSGFTDVTLGLSGGVDSALVAAIAVDALGAEHVHAVGMPTRFTSDLSLRLGDALAGNLSIDYVVRPIEGAFAAMKETLAADFAGLPEDLTEENLQARIRGMMLMAHANKFGRLVLTTGNKSESAVGYSTLYGDTAGAFAPIRDVLKTDVWELCRTVNRAAGFARIPEEIITRAPSAELRDNQTDQQSLPEYAVLDAVIRAYVEEGKTVAEIVASGMEEPVVRRIVRMIHGAEFKRRQCPIGPKVSRTAFGRDWRFPIVCRHRGV